MLVLDMSVLLSCALVSIVVGIIVPLYVRFGLILTSFSLIGDIFFLYY
jgi:hypothetical protein